MNWVEQVPRLHFGVIKIIIKQFLWFLVSTQNQNSMEKIGQNFHICLRSVADPPPPYDQPDRKISGVF